MRLCGRLIGVLAGLAICASAAGPAVAAPGDLDTSFGQGGKSMINLGDVEWGERVILQPDGRILVAGIVAKPFVTLPEFFVARVLNPQGTIDTSYGLGSGWSRLGFNFAQDGGIALQPDGKIILATTSRPDRDKFAVARLLSPQGTLDPGFHSPDGFNTFNYSGTSNEDVADLILQPDGKVLIGGTSNFRGTRDMTIARVLNPEGTLDASYGLGTGGSVFDFAGQSDSGNAIALQADGKILVAGTADAFSPAADFGVGRAVVPGGTADPSFGDSGTQRVDFGGKDEASDVAVQPDGKIVLAGTTGGSDFGLARLLSNGGLDLSFAGGGKALFNIGDDDRVSAMALQPDGKIVVAGESGPKFAVARFQPNGTPDTTFADNGRSVFGFGANNTGSALSLVLQPDGKIVVAGTSSPNRQASNIALARLQGDPPGEVKGKCRGKKATILGTNAKDKLKGTKRKDVVSAGAGKDTVKGLKGNDLICGGKGKDKLLGGPGKDKLFGEQGNDKILGGPGKDKLRGGAGRKDKLNGGPGKDSEKP